MNKKNIPFLSQRYKKSFYKMSFLSLVFVVGILSVVGADEDVYPDTWIHIDVKPIIDNDRLFKKYTECIIADENKGCPKEALQLKRLLPEILETDCAKCTPAHIEKAREAATHVCNTRKSEFIAINRKIDPTGEIRKRFESKFGGVPECDALRV
ncbi:ejaculatory bulb-specific protein 3-like [Belonocnema kinseyi]|uniref:ejaculatory bulb-specific protein 3-like n=1 Tax=Belonocnema kinseyi TaxID=2817044 RepID=UPI00143D341D|nr:ejaculatory bulb-specific protein 3-like [Belonocnema kinseyi]